MQECYLEATNTGVKDVSIDASSEVKGVVVTVAFAIGTDTDAEAWVTIDETGQVSPNFGGTGIYGPELDSYVQHAVDIWQAVSNTDAPATLSKSLH